MEEQRGRKLGGSLGRGNLVVGELQERGAELLSRYLRSRNVGIA